MSTSNSFGTDAHNATVAEQTVNAGSALTKSTMIVVLSPTVNGNQLFRAENSGNVVQFVAQGKALNRITDLLSMAGDGSHVEFQSAAATIDERCMLKNSAAMIIRYTVNGGVERLQKTLSEALFRIAEKAANDNTTLASYAARFGIHAIAVASESSSYDAVMAISAQLESYGSSETNFVPALKANVEQINAPVINWSEIPVNPLLEGAALSFVVRSEPTRVNFLINPVKGYEVKDQKALSVFTRENQSSVTMEEKVAALEAIGYDLAAMPDEEIALSYDQERKDFVEETGVLSAASSDEEEEEEEDGEEFEEEEEEDDSEAQSASEILAGILTQADLDRSQLKKLVFMIGAQVLKRHTSEDLTVILLEHVEAFDYNQLFQFVLEANTRLEGVDGFADWLHAESEEVEEAEESEEESEDGDDSDEEAEDEDEDEDEESEDDSEEEEEEEEHSFDPVSEFVDLVGDDFSRETIRAIARSELFALKTYKGDDAAAILERITDALQTGDVDYSSPEEFEALIRALAELEPVQAEFPTWAEYEVNPTNYAELFHFEGGSLSHDQRVNALEAVGEEVPEGAGMVAVLKLFETYRRENGYAFAEEEGTESADDSEEADDENFALDAGAENEEEEESEEEEDGAAFVESSSTNDLGTFVRVRQEQSLLVNFTLTDRDTFEDIMEELSNQEGIDYRMPINQTKEIEGSMYLPLTVVGDLLDQSAALPFMSDRKSFNVETYAEKLERTLRGNLDALLYEGRLEAGEDPYSTGLTLGDFIEDDEISEDEEEGFSADYLKELAGDHIPMASLYNAHVGVRPVSVETENTVLNTIVLNLALPGIWSIKKAKIKDLVQSAFNRVLGHLNSDTTKVYVGFTLNSSNLIADENLQAVVKAVTDLATGDVNAYSFSSNDVRRITESDDLMEAALSVGSTNLPLTLLSSGVADAAFANGGDLTVLLSPVSSESESE